MVASKILIGLEGYFIVTCSFAIDHSFHGILDFNWERGILSCSWSTSRWLISSRTDSSIGLMLMKTFSKSLQITSPVSSSDLVNEPSDLRSFKFRGFKWWPQKPLFIHLNTSHDLKGLLFSISSHVFHIHHSFTTCMASFRFLRAQQSFEQASHRTSSFIA